MKSRITDCEAEPIFRAKVLGKYDVQYYRCPETGFIQTEEPYWLDEAYSEAITHLDIGLLARNINVRPIVAHAISRLRAEDDHFIDYGGGYGIFVRLMRDWGYRFYRMDPHCKNLFAAGFDYEDAMKSGVFTGRASMLTAFEVLEHLVDPIPEFEKMFEYSDTILATTSLIPQPTPESANAWWYFTPETGQHVSLYTRDALKCIATRFDARLITNNKDLHLLTRDKNTRWRPPSRFLSHLNQMSLRWRRTRLGRELIHDDFALAQKRFQEANASASDASAN